MMMLKKFIPQFLTVFLLLAGFSSVSAQLNDSLLREQLTRGVQLWQQGNAAGAYTTLDSVIAQPTSAEIAATKVKAAIWTATYLQQQKKNAPALKFLDSAKTWAEQYARGEEYKRVYEAYAQWHVNTGNLKGALAAKDQAHAIADSLLQVRFANTADSIQQSVTAQQDSLSKSIAAANEAKANESPLTPMVIGLILLVVLLLFIVFRLYTNLQRMRTLPPAPQARGTSPAPRKQESKPEPVTEPVISSTGTETEVAVKPVVSPPLTAAPVNAKDLTVKLAEVELVLIRPEVLGRYGNGEWKGVKNLLNEYLTQLPLILKNLDDAITRSETAPILQGLEYLKPYLGPFGMSSTLALIKEVEDEASEVKANKLLSRVFQVRNHTRRAADEAKAILEKFS